MTLIGIPGQGIREVRFYFARVVADVLRGETRNCGLIVRVAESSVLTYRFMEVPPVIVEGYHEVIRNWKDGFEEYGIRGLHFIGKREGNKYANPKLYIEPGFSRMVVGRVNFDVAFERLVMPSGRE